VDVGGQVDGKPSYSKLDVLPVFRIETTQHVVVRDGAAFASPDIDPWSRSKDFRSLFPGGGSEHVSLDFKVARASVFRAPVALPLDDDFDIRCGIELGRLSCRGGGNTVFFFG